MLMTAMAHIKELNPAAIVSVFGQELNDETWAIAQSDLMMQDRDADPTMRNGNTLTQDAFRTEKFDVILANPPYGVDWKAYAAPIKTRTRSRASTAASAPACPVSRTARSSSCSTCSAR
jgi:type I restriction enzyme M protein